MRTYIGDDSEIYGRAGPLSNIAAPQRVCVIGVGGVGSWVAINMAMMGCERLVILDPDTVEIHNLNRTLFKHYQIGWNKVDAIYDIVREMRNTTITPHCCKWEDLDPETRKDYAQNYLVIDCRDTIAPLPENPRTLVTGGYDGTRCTIHYNPDFSTIFGDDAVRYRVTPSYLVIPQFIASCITNFICFERPYAEGNRIRHNANKERFITFDFADLSDMLCYGNAVMESERAAETMGHHE